MRSGSPELDSCIKGGFKTGNIYEVYGQAGTGKKMFGQAGTGKNMFGQAGTGKYRFGQVGTGSGRLGWAGRNRFGQAGTGTGNNFILIYNFRFLWIFKKYLSRMKE